MARNLLAALLLLLGSPAQASPTQLAWSEEPGADGYRVYRAEQSCSTITPETFWALMVTLQHDQVLWSDPDTLPGHTYCYYVSPLFPDGREVSNATHMEVVIPGS